MRVIFKLPGDIEVCTILDAIPSKGHVIDLRFVSREMFLEAQPLGGAEAFNMFNRKRYSGHSWSIKRVTWQLFPSVCEVVIVLDNGLRPML